MILTISFFIDVCFRKFLLFFGPTLWSFKFSPVCLSVSLSVRLKRKILILPTIGFLRYLAQSCSEVKVEKWRSPIFEKKSWFFFISNFMLFLRVFWTFLENRANDLAKNAYLDRADHYLQLLHWSSVPKNYGSGDIEFGDGVVGYIAQNLTVSKKNYFSFFFELSHSELKKAIKKQKKKFSPIEVGHPRDLEKFWEFSKFSNFSIFWTGVSFGPIKSIS